MKYRVERISALVPGMWVVDLEESQSLEPALRYVAAEQEFLRLWSKAPRLYRLVSDSGNIIMLPHGESR